MTIPGVQTLGLIGAGNIGGEVARAATRAGYAVVLSNSRGPETLRDLVAELGPTARADTPAGAAAAGDLVVVTVPLRAINDLPLEALAGKTVLDTNNYYPERDGRIAALDSGSTTSSQLLQDLIPTARVVKAFNHIYAAQITSDATPAGTVNRRALAIAGDDRDAKAQVAALIDDLGFDVVDLGTLADSWRIEPETPGYGPQLTAAELTAAIRGTEHRPVR